MAPEQPDPAPRFIGGGIQTPQDKEDRDIAVASMFPFDVEGYDGRRGRSLAEYLRLTGLPLEDLLASDAILDLGAGPEARLRDELAEAAKKLNLSHVPQVISLSLAYADDRVRRNLLRRTGSAEGAVAADLARLPFADGTFSRILSVFLFPHVQDSKLEDAVKEVARVLAPHGTLVIVPVRAPKEKRDYVWKPDQKTVDQLRVKALKDPNVAKDVRLHQMLQETFTGKGKIYVVDLPPKPGSEVENYKFRRITVEKD